MDGMLVARTSSIATIRTQPAACHGDEMPLLPPDLVGTEERPQSPAQQDQRGAERQKCELGCTTSDCVECRPTTGANPERGKCHEYDCGHGNADAEPDGIANTVSGIRVAVTQVFSGAVHRSLIPLATPALNLRAFDALVRRPVVAGEPSVSRQTNRQWAAAQHRS